MSLMQPAFGRRRAISPWAVSASIVMKNALILDTDLGYAFWLCRGLDQVGYESFPARSVSDALTLLEDLAIGLDLLIVDSTVPGAADFIEALRRVNDRVKVVALSGNPGLAARADVYCRKPERGS